MAKLTKAVDAGAPDAGSPSEDVVRPPDRVTTEHVVAHVRALIEKGELRPGDRLPPERELAVQIGVSRPSVRAGLQALLQADGSVAELNRLLCERIASGELDPTSPKLVEHLWPVSDYGVHEHVLASSEVPP